MKTKNYFLLLFFSAFLFFSLKCNRGEEKIDEGKLKSHLVNVNRILVKEEQKQIEEFITNHHWKMDSTGTGLRYMIYEKGNGKSVAVHDAVKVIGKIFLIDATLCYEYKQADPLEFSVGNKDVPRGLEEAVLLMKEGDKGRFVIPSHLGYGLLGDREKIPGNASLFADLELTNITTSK